MKSDKLRDDPYYSPTSTLIYHVCSVSVTTLAIESVDILLMISIQCRL